MLLRDPIGCVPNIGTKRSPNAFLSGYLFLNTLRDIARARAIHTRLAILCAGTHPGFAAGIQTTRGKQLWPGSTGRFTLLLAPKLARFERAHARRLAFAASAGTKTGPRLLAREV